MASNIALQPQRHSVPTSREILVAFIITRLRKVARQFPNSDFTLAAVEVMLGQDEVQSASHYTAYVDAIERLGSSNTNLRSSHVALLNTEEVIELFSVHPVIKRSGLNNANISWKQIAELVVYVTEVISETLTNGTDINIGLIVDWVVKILEDIQCCASTPQWEGLLNLTQLAPAESTSKITQLEQTPQSQPLHPTGPFLFPMLPLSTQSPLCDELDESAQMAQTALMAQMAQSESVPPVRPVRQMRSVRLAQLAQSAQSPLPYQSLPHPSHSQQLPHQSKKEKLFPPEKEMLLQHSQLCQPPLPLHSLHALTQLQQPHLSQSLPIPDLTEQRPALITQLPPSTAHLTPSQYTQEEEILELCQHPFQLPKQSQLLPPLQLQPQQLQLLRLQILQLQLLQSQLQRQLQLPQLSQQQLPQPQLLQSQLLQSQLLQSQLLQSQLLQSQHQSLRHQSPDIQQLCQHHLSNYTSDLSVEQQIQESLISKDTQQTQFARAHPYLRPNVNQPDSYNPFSMQSTGPNLPMSTHVLHDNNPMVEATNLPENPSTYAQINLLTSPPISTTNSSPPRSQIHPHKLPIDEEYPLVGCTCGRPGGPQRKDHNTGWCMYCKTIQCLMCGQEFDSYQKVSTHLTGNKHRRKEVWVTTEHTNSSVARNSKVPKLDKNIHLLLCRCGLSSNWSYKLNQYTSKCKVCYLITCLVCGKTDICHRTINKHLESSVHGLNFLKTVDEQAITANNVLAKKECLTCHRTGSIMRTRTGHYFCKICKPQYR